MLNSDWSIQISGEAALCKENYKMSWNSSLTNRDIHTRKKKQKKKLQKSNKQAKKNVSGRARTGDLPRVRRT